VPWGLMSVSHMSESIAGTGPSFALYWWAPWRLRVATSAAAGVAFILAWRPLAELYRRLGQRDQRCYAAESYCHRDAMPPLARLAGSANHSWIEQLSPDPEIEKFAPNKQEREVHSGHYVLVTPTPLPRPKLVIHSPAMADALGISDEEVVGEDFVVFFSGEQRRVPELRSWCTPYALAIMGEEYNHQCIFGTGNGYGDGRAVSVGEVLVDGRRWEMQLKGGGKTPFCRGADGRAVLRSSVREFLASEAMHNLGVETTRALSLVVSTSETVSRPWYGKQTVAREQCAITTRVAPSFLRVGHLDLFARRARRSAATPLQLREHAQLIEHAIFREFPEVQADMPLEDRALAMLDLAAERFGALIAGWLRVGFCQGNFNADNCLISGRTMDYGPFGFLERYDPNFCLWTNGKPHFAFRNQPQAALANYMTLANAVLPNASRDTRQGLMNKAAAVIEAAEAETWRKKLGFAVAGSTVASSSWKELDVLLRRSEVDYTMFWRQLAAVAELPETSLDRDASIAEPVMCAFYTEPTGKLLVEWARWLRDWRSAVASEAAGGGGLAAAPARLRAVNPKYVPREWMLANAYTQAQEGDFGGVHELYKLFLCPYAEQPDLEAKYYCRAPEEVRNKGGIAFMT